MARRMIYVAIAGVLILQVGSAFGGWSQGMYAPKSDLDHVQGVVSAPGEYVASPGGVVITGGGANFTVVQGDNYYCMDGPYGESGNINWTENYTQAKSEAFTIHYTEWHGNYVTYSDFMSWNGSSWGSVTFTKDVPRLGCHDAMDGRFSEGQDGGHRGAPGNVLNASSWGGSTLGTQWTLSGLTLKTVTEKSNTVVGGNGQIVYETAYDSGTLTMKVGGPWGDSSALSADLTAEMQGIVASTHTYVGGTLAGVTSTVVLDGWLEYADPRPDLRVLVSADVAFDGFDASSVPGGYPSASTPLDYGTLTNTEVCIIPEPATMALLTMGGVALLRRRRKS